MENYTDKKFWDEYFNRRKHEPTTVENSLFSDIFDKYLIPNKSKTVLEIGCADSNFLCYLAKKFGYQAYGIDYSEAITRTADLLKFNSLPEPKLYKEDLFSWKPDIKFDVVCSFGFIEHFDDINPVIKKHAELVVPGGKLIVTLPHFAHAQYFLHWLIDRENLKKHNTKIMNLDSIRKAIIKSGMKIEYLSYYKTFGFWTERNNMASWEKVVNWLIIKSGKVITRIFGYNYPNQFLSPHIVCVASRV
ncbi:MAG: class I SAM-dependent methyltransferase [bacterium]|nr:class I SAM-dependent methyltransferase [bacterium]